jgi:hypothetical protein
LRKAVLGGLVEIEVEGHEPTLIDFNYAENGVNKKPNGFTLK